MTFRATSEYMKYNKYSSYRLKGCLGSLNVLAGVLQQTGIKKSIHDLWCMQLEKNYSWVTFLSSSLLRFLWLDLNFFFFFLFVCFFATRSPTPRGRHWLCRFIFYFSFCWTFWVIVSYRSPKTIAIAACTLTFHHVWVIKSLWKYLLISRQHLLCFQLVFEPAARFTAGLQNSSRTLYCCEECFCQSSGQLTSTTFHHLSSHQSGVVGQVSTAKTTVSICSPIH